MNTEIISREDINFLTQQSSENLNMILSGMTSLMNDTDSKVSMMEKQTWFQRMCKTISGKNKMTLNEIQRNHDQINIYMSQAISELFDQQCIDRQVMIGLGNRINEIYESQIELKQMLGAFVVKLNQKIESIDNFHMLTEEINQGVYSIYKPFAAISKIMSQLDMRTINDSRKMKILVRAIEIAGIITDEEKSLALILEDLLYISESDAGIISILYGNMQDDFIAGIIEDTIFSYYLLPENIRKMKNRKSIIENVLKTHEVDINYCISIRELYTSLIETYVNNLLQASIAEEENKLAEQHNNLMKYLDKCKYTLGYLNEMIDTWQAKGGEKYYRSQKKIYINCMINIINNLSKDSCLREALDGYLSNIMKFIKFVLLKYPDLKEIANKELLETIADDYIEQFKRTFIFNNDGLIGLPQFDNDFNPNGLKYFTLNSIFDQIYRNFKEYIEIEKKSVDNDGTSLSGMSNLMELTTFVSEFVAFFEQFKILCDSISYMIGNEYSNYQELYKVIERFPIEFEVEYKKQFNDILWRKDNNSPYISISESNNRDTEDGYTYYTRSQLYECKIFILKFHNIGKGFTVSYHIENGKNYYSVEWGDWIGSNELEIKVTNNDNRESWLRNLKIKIYIKDNPEICAYIEYY